MELYEQLKAEFDAAFAKVKAQFADGWQPGDLLAVINQIGVLFVRIAEASGALGPEKKAAVLEGLKLAANNIIDAINWFGPDWATKPFVKWFVNLCIDRLIESLVKIEKHPETV